MSWTKPRRTEYMERVEKARGAAGREELAKEILKWYATKRGSKR